MAKKVGLEATFITNGTKLGELDLDKLFMSIDRFGLSLDSIEQEEINKLWGNTSVVLEDTILKSLLKINEWAKNNKKIHITMQPIVTALNMNSLKKLVAYINENLNYCEIDWMITQYNPIKNEKIDELLKISMKEHVSCVVDSLSNLCKKADFNNKEDYDRHINEIKLYALTNSAKLIPAQAPKVMTCAPSFFVVQNGDIYPCQGFEDEEYF